MATSTSPKDQSRLQSVDNDDDGGAVTIYKGVKRIARCFRWHGNADK